MVNGENAPNLMAASLRRVGNCQIILAPKDLRVLLQRMGWKPGHAHAAYAGDLPCGDGKLRKL